MTSLANDSSTIAELVAALNRLNVVVEGEFNSISFNLELT